MNKDEVRDWLKELFQITDPARVDVVWEEMEKARINQEKEKNAKKNPA